MKKALTGILSLLLIFLIAIILVNVFKGPVLTIENCNENMLLGSKVCNNSNGYYYIGDNNDIFYINNDGTSEVFYDNGEFDYIACNSKYIYISNKKELVQLSLNGTVINAINTDTDMRFISNITGLFADESGLFCNQVSSYLMLDPNTLEKMTIGDYMDNPQNANVGEIQIFSDNNTDIISSPVSLNPSDSYIVGTAFLGNDRVLNISLNDIVGYSEQACIKYIQYNGTVLENVFDNSEYRFDSTDIRHIYAQNNQIVAFNSVYSKNDGLRYLCFIDYKYNSRDFGLYDEVPLMFHKYDCIRIVDLQNNKVCEHKTKSGEKVLYLSSQKAITYYKGQYLTYSLSDWEVIKKQNADEIKNGGSYTFESCGEYVFVFDGKQGKLINTIGI